MLHVRLDTGGDGGRWERLREVLRLGGLRWVMRVVSGGGREGSGRCGGIIGMLLVVEVGRRGGGLDGCESRGEGFLRRAW